MQAKQKISIIIIEDDRYYSKLIKTKLDLYGDVIVVDSFVSAVSTLNKSQFDIAFIDINLGGAKSGLDLLDITGNKGIYSVILTDSLSSDLIKNAYQKGCDNFLGKGQGELAIQDTVKNFIKNRKKNNVFDSFNFYTYHRPLKADLERLAPSVSRLSPIILLGENGTGKSKIAKIIHSLSKNDNFYKIKLQSSTTAEIRKFLLGDLENKREQWFLKFKNSTLYLDGIPALSLSDQEYLLRLIIRNDFKSFNIQIVTSATENIFKNIKDGLFLEELFMAINMTCIKIPPIRERKEDIPLLIDHLLKLINKSHTTIDDEAMECLQKYDWPSNVKELFSTMTDLTTAYKHITKERLPGGILNTKTLKRHHYDDTKFISDEQQRYLIKYGLNEFVEKTKLEAVKELMKNNEFKTGEALKQSKVSRAVFFRLVKKSMQELGNYGQ